MRYCANSGKFVLQYFGILGGIKYYPPSLLMFSEPFPVSDSFGNRPNSKITRLKLDLHKSKLFRIRFAVYTQVEKSEVKPLLFGCVCLVESEI